MIDSGDICCNSDQILEIKELITEQLHETHIEYQQNPEKFSAYNTTVL